MDLAATAGLFADPWQSDVIDVLLSVRLGGRWACPEVGIVIPRQNGKGSILEIRALAGMFLLSEELIMWSAHEYKTAMEGFRRTRALIARLGKRLNDNLYNVDGALVKISNTNGDEGFERLDTGQRIRYIARSKGSGRGFSGDVNIIDESYAYTFEQQAALLPTLSARPNPQIIYTSSPPLDATTGEPMFDLRARGEAGGDLSLGWFDWGAPRGVDPDDRQEWAKSNPALGIRISEEAVERERRAMASDPDGFCRERLGVWPKTLADQWQVISESAWTAAADGRSEALDPVAFAIDVTPDRSWSCIAVAGRRKDGLRHLEVVEHRRGTSWVAPWLVDRVKTWKPCAVVVDPGSPAASLLADLEAGGVEVVTTSARDVAQACGALFDGIVGEELAGRDIRYLPHGALTAAVAGAAKRKLGDAWAWDRLNSSVDISPLVAGTLALWGHASQAHLVKAAPDPMFAFA